MPTQVIATTRIDRNATTIGRLRRNFQRLAAQTATTAVALSPTGGISTGSTGLFILLPSTSGLSTNSTGLFIVDSPTGGIYESSTGQAILFSSTSGVSTNLTGLFVKFSATTSGLSTNSTGLGVFVDGSTITVNGSNQLVASGSTASVDTSTINYNSRGQLSVVLKSTGGISTDTPGLYINIISTGGLSTNSTGIGILFASTSGLSTNSTGIGVLLDPNGGLSTNSTGLGILCGPASGMSTNAVGLNAMAFRSTAAGFPVPPSTSHNIYRGDKFLNQVCMLSLGSTFRLGNVGTVFSATTPGVTVANTAANSPFSINSIGQANLQFPSTFLSVVGRTLRLEAFFKVSALSQSTVTLTFQYGTTPVLQFPNVAVGGLTNAILVASGLVIVQVAGAVGSTQGVGVLLGTSPAAPVDALTNSGIDLRPEIVADWFAQWSNASPSNTITLKNVTVEILS